MSIVNLVESARKSISPIVGISLPGGSPFCLRRSLLVESLKGLRIIDAGIQLTLDGKSSQLVIYAVGERVQAIRRFAPITNHYQCRVDIWKWADAERIKRAEPKARISGREKQVIRWQKKLAKVGKPRIPQHPLLYNGCENVKWRMEHDAKELKAWEALAAEGCVMNRPLSVGEQWAIWKQEAKVRRWIQLQARLCKSGKLTTTQLYHVLMKRGVKARKWSDLRTCDKRGCGDLFGYLAKLWEFCGLSTKPSYWFDTKYEFVGGPEHYKSWLEHLHEYKELEGMISGVKQVELTLKFN